jgi:N-acetylglucosaminyl-diphospho-decaprenol L-rhamnosyltransferase
MMQHDLGIVIVNWNTCDLLRKCLATVTASVGDFRYRALVVDNASTDDSAAMVHAEFPNIELIVNPINGGFSYANNIGLRALGFGNARDVAAEAPRYALLLNPDTEVPPTSLYEMVRFMDRRPDVGVAGPKLLMRDGSLDKACKRGLPTPAVAFYHYSGLAKLFPKNPTFGRYNMTHISDDTETEVDSVVGAYMQVRRECVEAVGLLDEVFFMYGEDIDWAYRVQQAGWKVWYYPAVTVHHMKRASSVKSPKAAFEFWRAMLLFYRKHFRTTTPWPVHVLVLAALSAKGGRKLWPEVFQLTKPHTNQP